MMNETKNDTLVKIDVITLEMKKHKPILVKEESVSSKYRAIDLIASQIKKRDREVFVVLGLNTKGYPTTYCEVHQGTLNQALIHPREIFKQAILTNANGVILAHNHPSGDTTPSKQDIEITKTVVAAGEVLGINVHDHIIVSMEGGISLREEYPEIFETNGGNSWI